MKKKFVTFDSSGAGNALGQVLSSLPSSKRYDHAKAFLSKFADSGLLDAPIGSVTPDHLGPVKDRLQTLQYTRTTLYRLCQELAILVKELVARGLSPDCLGVFRPAKRPEVVALEPLSVQAMRKMLAQLPNEPFTVQMLFWLGVSGGPHIEDAALLRRDQVDLNTGLVRLTRHKTGNNSEFFLVKPGLDLLKTQPYKEGEAYVFPELVYTKGQHNQH